MTPAGREVPIVWRGRRVRAFVPDLLAARDLDLSAPAAARAATAAAELGHAAERLATHDDEALARLVLRSEGVASSFIEGVRAPVVDVVLALHGAAGVGEAAWVAANLAAIGEALAETHAPLSVDMLCGWHRTLMTGSPTPGRYVGVVRGEQGWIGGHDPTDAHLVTPPPDELPELLGDLVAYACRTDVDPVAQAAVAHAQFEIIHPFADGNGRVGRIMAGWVLVRRLALIVGPPLSVAIAADVGGYTAGLTRFRMGDHNGWVMWFADAIRDAGRAQSDLVMEVDAVKARWRARLGGVGGAGGRALRLDAAAWAVLDLLPRHVVLTTSDVTAALGITTKAAKDALDQLARAGIVLPHGVEMTGARGRPPVRYVAPELLALAGSTPFR